MMDFLALLLLVGVAWSIWNAVLAHGHPLVS
jgi:hypothetical protein